MLGGGKAVTAESHTSAFVELVCALQEQGHNRKSVEHVQRVEVLWRTDTDMQGTGVGGVGPAARGWGRAVVSAWGPARAVAHGPAVHS